MAKGTQSAVTVSSFPSQTHLKHKHVSPSRYWADQDGVEDLVILFTLCGANIDDLPFKVCPTNK